MDTGTLDTADSTLVVPEGPHVPFVERFVGDELYTLIRYIHVVLPLYLGDKSPVGFRKLVLLEYVDKKSSALHLEDLEYFLKINGTRNLRGDRQWNDDFFTAIEGTDETWAAAYSLSSYKMVQASKTTGIQLLMEDPNGPPKHSGTRKFNIAMKAWHNARTRCSNLLFKVSP
jgi:hypothetical protein